MTVAGEIKPQNMLAHAVTHGDPGTDLLWSHVNVGEAVPGVVTPLTAAFWHHSHTAVPRAMYRELGVMRAAEMGAPFTPANTPVQFLFGRMAANVDVLRALADRMPGTSGADLEEQMLGSVRPDAVVHKDRSRYLHVVVALVKLFLTMPGRARAVRARTLDRWTAQLRAMETASFEEACAALEWEMSYGQADVIGTHGLSALLSPVVWSPMAALARKHGSEDDVLALSAGLGGVEEAALMDELWQVAHEGRGLESFFDAHGYMGPDSGELSARPWRASQSSLQAALASFKADGTRPRARQAAMADRLTQTRERLSRQANPFERAALKVSLWLCRTYLPLREVSKAAMTAHADIGRLCADRVGELLVQSGRIDQAQDVYFLQPGEFEAARAADLRPVIDARKIERSYFQSLDIPDAYTGADIPAILSGHASAPVATDRLEGLGVSRGTVEGVVRVITSADDFDAFQAGEILVCPTTDPGWTPVFSVAAAMVVDIGGMLSHSAIIARELGVPAVVNTRHGTRALKTGQRVRVDGETGAVTLLDGVLHHAAEEVSDTGIDPRLIDISAPRPLHLVNGGDGFVLLADAQDAARYGGKAASLARSLASGLPVPNGIAIAWDRAEDYGPLPDFDGPVAVRSSGIGEDGQGSSFAGQHDTILGVDGADAIRAAVAQVAGSAHADHVAAYRALRGEDDAPRIGIVVQQLIPASVAGVMFTRDPLGGPHRIIEAAWGLGEVVVGSRVTPDHFEVDPDSGAVRTERLGRKTLMIDRHGEHAVIEGAACARCLSDAQIVALNALASQCETAFGAPQDIEWAFAGEALFLLQSRPITTQSMRE